MPGLMEPEKYIQETQLHKLVNSMISRVLHFQPADPVDMMMEHLLEQRVSSHGGAEGSEKLADVLGLTVRRLESRKTIGGELDNKEKELVSRINQLAGPGVFEPLVPQMVAPRGNALAKLRQVSRVPEVYSKLMRSQKAAEMLLQVALQMTHSAVDNSEVMIRELMTGARRLLNADRCTFFLVDNQELVSQMAEGSGEIRIPLNSGLAGHVAVGGEHINITDAWEDPRFNRTVDEETGYRTRSLLCMPVMFEGHTVAVAQLLNKADNNGAIGAPFTHEDVELFEAFSVFAGVCIRNQQLYSSTEYEKRKNQLFLKVIDRLSKHTDIRDLDSVIKTVVEGITELLVADRATVFVADKEHHTLVSKVAMGAGSTVITTPMTQGIAGRAASEKITINIKDAYQDDRFNPESDKRMGYVTKTILAMPIHNGNNEVVAVAQVINKLRGTFTQEDEEMLHYFSYFAGIAISNATLYDFLLQSSKKTMELIEVANSPVPPSPTTKPGTARGSRTNFLNLVPDANELSRIMTLSKQIPRQEIDSLFTPDFNVHLYGLGTEKYTYVPPMAKEILDRFGYLDRFGVPEDALLRFMACVRKKYRPVPYHSITHAFDVMQTVMIYLHHYKIEELLTPLDCFLLLISAILHDIDHMGLNNSFHLKAETPLGVLSAASGSSSVLEIHHCSLSIELISMPECNIFVGLSPEDRKFAFKTLVNNILATDMARHKEFLDMFREMVEAGYDKENVNHRQLVCQMVLKTADISNVSKPFDISRQWGLAMTEEFFLQGDQERERRMTVTKQFDRAEFRDLATSQIGFISAVVLGMMKMEVETLFPGMKPAFDNLQSNLQAWQSLLQEQERVSSS